MQKYIIFVNYLCLCPIYFGKYPSYDKNNWDILQLFLAAILHYNSVYICHLYYFRPPSK